MIWLILHKLNDVSLSCVSEVYRQLSPYCVVTEYDVELWVLASLRGCSCVLCTSVSVYGLDTNTRKLAELIGTSTEILAGRLAKMCRDLPNASPVTKWPTGWPWRGKECRWLCGCTQVRGCKDSKGLVSNSRHLQRRTHWLGTVSCVRKSTVVACAVCNTSDETHLICLELGNFCNLCLLRSLNSIGLSVFL